MIRFSQVKKVFKTKEVIRDFNLTIEKGQIVALIGESGSGKTTLLKMINKLISTSGGDIYVDGLPISTWDTTQLRRSLGYVIQQHGLFPHMTIKENIQVIPKLMGCDLDDLETRTNNLLNKVGLNPLDYLNAFPTQLSGGQQQRVGIVRALITDPEIILMDEPFSALDPMTREDLQEELLSIQNEFNKTIVFVTHDMDEALKLADKICILRNGTVLQYDTPENILKNPADEYVENFIGKDRIWQNPSFISSLDAAILKPATIEPTRTVLQAVAKMRDKKVDSLLVVDKMKTLIGIVTLNNLTILGKGHLTIEHVMTTEFESIHQDTTLVHVIEKFDAI
ncbi:MAG: ABC transporter ATP-binding protein, partial [Turicibacter sp.]